MSELLIENDFRTVDGLSPDERRVATRAQYSPVVLVVAIVATLGILGYATFLLNPANLGDWIPWLLVVACESILVFHALMSMWTMLAGYGKQSDFAFHDAQAKLYKPKGNAARGVQDDPTAWPLYINGTEVSVDVLVTVYGEPIETIRRTVTHAMAMRGLHSTYVLDDGDSDEVRDLAASLGCSYLRRLGSSGAKAGNVNNALTVAKSDFFVILDADFVVEPEFLEETLPHMADSNVAFVQTPQVYGNLHNIISRGAGYMQSMFYRFVQPGRNQFNAAFCVGTNVLFRRAAVMDVGGIYTQSKSEDVWTSLALHERGWRSVFVPQRLATGDAPDTIEAYSKQQLRWATGGFEILLSHNPLSRKRNLTVDQKLMHFVTATHYLTGIAPGLLLLVPALEVFFDLRPVNIGIPWWQWVLSYSGFYVLQVLLAAIISGTFRPEVLLLAANSFPIYIKAFRNAFLDVDTNWSVTGATGGRASAFNFIRPQVWTFVFLLGTSAVSIWRDVNLNHANVATFWALTNTLIVGAFVATAFRENWARRLPQVDHTLEARATGDAVEASDFVPLLDREAIVALRERRDTAAQTGELQAAPPGEGPGEALVRRPRGPIPLNDAPRRALIPGDESSTSPVSNTEVSR